MLCFVDLGTSHSLAWTTLPTDRQVIAWHRPFCVDLQETTFTLLRTFLERYCTDFDQRDTIAPFSTKEEQESFVMLCLRLLITHLSLAQAGGVAGSVLGEEAKPLRMLLFRFISSL